MSDGKKKCVARQSLRQSCFVVHQPLDTELELPRYVVSCTRARAGEELLYATYRLAVAGCCRCNADCLLSCAVCDMYHRHDECRSRAVSNVQAVQQSVPLHVRPCL